MEKHNVILDVRTKKEYCSGHLCNSINIPTPLPPFTEKTKKKLFNDLKKFVIKYKLPPKIPIIIYCKKGIRAEQAKIFLKQLGMKKVRNIGGVEIQPLKSTIEKYNIICYCK